MHERVSTEWFTFIAYQRMRPDPRRRQLGRRCAQAAASRSHPGTRPHPDRRACVLRIHGTDLLKSSTTRRSPSSKGQAKRCENQRRFRVHRSARQAHQLAEHGYGSAIHMQVINFILFIPTYFAPCDGVGDVQPVLEKVAHAKLHKFHANHSRACLCQMVHIIRVATQWDCKRVSAVGHTNLISGSDHSVHLDARHAPRIRGGRDSDLFDDPSNSFSNADRKRCV